MEGEDSNVCEKMKDGFSRVMRVFGKLTSYG